MRQKDRVKHLVQHSTVKRGTSKRRIGYVYMA